MPSDGLVRCVRIYSGDVEDVRCDDVMCTEVCRHGTVQLEASLEAAIKLQVSYARNLPLCYAQWLGTHNSAITLADGYGNRDGYFTKLLKFTKWDQGYAFETNDQWFSLTDQLNMGARLLEVDVHWVKGDLRIAHCGGLKNKALDALVHLINFVSRLLHYDFRWDTETVGCYPSGSSIKATDQRLFADAMDEIADWMKCEDNHNEFLMILLDNQRNLEEWGLLSILKTQLLRHVPEEWIFTPSHHDLFLHQELPSANYLLSKGRRIMFLSTTHYSDHSIASLFFHKDDRILCGWWEPHVDALDTKSCTLPRQDYSARIPTMNGTISRIHSCEIQYGPFSCQLKYNDTEEVLDSSLIRKMFDCGFSFPSPDRLTPERALAAIWSWAPGQPDLNGEKKMETVISANDGRWRLRNYEDSQHLPIACVDDDSTLPYDWQLHDAQNSSTCREGFIPVIPRQGKENSNLQRAMKRHGYKEARIIGAYKDHFDSTIRPFINI